MMGSAKEYPHGRENRSIAIFNWTHYFCEEISNNFYLNLGPSNLTNDESHPLVYFLELKVSKITY